MALRVTEIFQKWEAKCSLVGERQDWTNELNGEQCVFWDRSSFYGHRGLAQQGFASWSLEPAEQTVQCLVTDLESTGKSRELVLWPCSHTKQTKSKWEPAHSHSGPALRRLAISESCAPCTGLTVEAIPDNYPYHRHPPHLSGGEKINIKDMHSVFSNSTQGKIT